MSSSAIEYLENLSKLSPEEFERFHRGNFLMAMDRDDNVLFGCPVMGVEMKLNMSEEILDDVKSGEGISDNYWKRIFGEYIGSELIAIFGGGTWNWTVGGGSATTTGSTNTGNSTPQATQTLYRRSTHDENGNAKQFTPAQNELWQTNFEIATMTHESIWRSAEEIANNANAYRTMTTRKKDSRFYSKDSASLVLEILANNGLVESKNA